MTDFKLGDRVVMSGTVKKHETRERGYKHTKYVEGPLPVKRHRYGQVEYDEGVVIGRRLVQAGTTEYHPDGTAVFEQEIGSAVRVWVVAFELRYKPVQCFDHQLQKLHSIDEVAQHLAQQDEQLPGQLSIDDAGANN